MSRNSDRYVGQPERSIDDLCSLTSPVVGPVTTGGWYLCEDGSEAKFAWIGGRLTLVAVAVVPSGCGVRVIAACHVAVRRYRNTPKGWDLV